MTLTRRRALAVASAGLALLAGCAGRGNQTTDRPPADTTTDGGPGDDSTATPPTADDATQVPTTGDGVRVAVRNADDEPHAVRVTGVDAAFDDRTVALGPGETHDVGLLDAPVDGEISYPVVVWVDGERVAERRVAVRPGGDRSRVTAHLRGDWVSWSETFSGPPSSDGAA